MVISLLSKNKYLHPCPHVQSSWIYDVLSVFNSASNWYLFVGLIKNNPLNLIQ